MHCRRNDHYSPRYSTPITIYNGIGAYREGLLCGWHTCYYRLVHVPVRDGSFEYNACMYMEVSVHTRACVWYSRANACIGSLEIASVYPCRQNLRHPTLACGMVKYMYAQQSQQNQNRAGAFCHMHGDSATP